MSWRTGVSQARLGQRVWIYEAQRGSAFGTAAEYVTIPAHKAVPMPASLTFEAGACLGVPAMTAHFLLFSDGPIVGKTVLVHAMSQEAHAAAIRDLTQAMVAGALQHRIAKRFALADAAAAHDAVDSGRLIGKAVLEVV